MGRFAGCYSDRLKRYGETLGGGAYLVRPACPRRGISFSFMSPFAESLLAIRAPLRLMVVYEKGSPVIFPLKSIPYIELVACI